MAILDPQAEVITTTQGGVVVALRWREQDSPATSELFQVLRLRDGKVVDIEDHTSRRSALKAVVTTPG